MPNREICNQGKRAKVAIKHLASKAIPGLSIDLTALRKRLGVSGR